MIHRRSLCLWITAALAVACGDGDTLGDGGMAMQGSTSVTNVCGDGRVGGDEQCDDGNSGSGDGCSNLCKNESPSGATPGGGDAGTSAPSTQDASAGGASAGGMMDAASGGDDAAAAGDAASADDAAGGGDATNGDAAGPATLEPLCPAEPAGACEQCNCTMCKTQLDACSNLPGEATEGPGMGKTKASLCEALVRCGRTTGCRSIGCLCNMETSSSCLMGTTPPDGPCKDEVLAAAETTDVMTFLTRATTPNSGYAVQLASGVSTCSEGSCAAACME